MADISEKVRLLQMFSGASPRGNAAWIVTLGYFPDDKDMEPAVSMTFKYEKQHFDEAAIVRVARHHFHGRAKKLADETATWEMTREEIEPLMKPEARTQSSSTDRTA